MMQPFTKDPDATLDYSQDWSDWLADDDTITDAIWTASPGITRVSSSHTTTGATVWLSGGTVNATYSLTCHITTAAGREDDRTIRVKVVSR